MIESMKTIERWRWSILAIPAYRYMDRIDCIIVARMMDKYKYLRHSRRTASARRPLFPEIWNCLSPRMIGRIYWQSCSLAVFTHSLRLKNRVRLRATVTRNQPDKTDELGLGEPPPPFLIPFCPCLFNDCEQARVTFSITAFISKPTPPVQSNWLKLDRFVCFFYSLLDG